MSISKEDYQVLLSNVSRALQAEQVADSTLQVDHTCIECRYFTDSDLFVAMVRAGEGQFGTVEDLPAKLLSLNLAFPISGVVFSADAEGREVCAMSCVSCTSRPVHELTDSVASAIGALATSWEVAVETVH